MLIYGEFIQDGVSYCNLYSNWKEFYRDTFSPEIEIVDVFELKVSGKSYEEQQICLEDLAIRYSNCEKPDLSYLELSTIEDWFYRKGKHYGLLTEFQINAIC